MPIHPTDGKQRAKLEALKKKEAEDLAQIMAKRHKLPYINLALTTVDTDSLKLLPEQDSRQAGMVVFQSVGKRLAVGLVNPTTLTAKQELNTLKNKGYSPELFLISELSLERAMAQYAEIPKFEEIEAGVIEVSPERLEKFSSTIKNIATLIPLLQQITTTTHMRKISEVLEIILAAAMQLDASDVHIEPQENNMRLRFRIDGVLQDVFLFSKEVYDLLLSRIKLASELKLNVHEKPQDGRLTVRMNNIDIEVRTATLPGPYGESIVMRILHPKTISLTLADLGFHPKVREFLEKEIRKPNGMILTTGPTGSGKTTTLYAFLKKVTGPKIKIVTIEDPIEYHVPGITQTQIDPSKGYDFASGLRSILRQDPDIILVGEIRDFETVEMALHAALTGHLVFSTLHTNEAVGTIPRVIDLGAKPNIIAPALNVALAQRLIRKLCEHCKQSYAPEKAEYERIQSTLKTIATPYKEGLEFPQTIKLWRAGSCDICNETGFKGRIGVFEIFIINDAVERLILKGSAAEQEFRAAAAEQGMLTLYQDGVLKVIQGLTALDELERLVLPPD